MPKFGQHSRFSPVGHLPPPLFKDSETPAWLGLSWVELVLGSDNNILQHVAATPAPPEIPAQSCNLHLEEPPDVEGGGEQEADEDVLDSSLKQGEILKIQFQFSVLIKIINQ